MSARNEDKTSGANQLAPQLNDRVLSPAFRTLEDAHSLPLTPIAVLSATFDTLVTSHIMGLLVMQS
jgi:hypothetical protein